jgi:F-type H+-transporting ATPase subunit alpha
VVRYEKALLVAMHDKGADILAAIRSEEEISEKTDGKLKTFIGDFTKAFA